MDPNYHLGMQVPFYYQDNELYSGEEKTNNIEEGDWQSSTLADTNMFMPSDINESEDSRPYLLNQIPFGEESNPPPITFRYVDEIFLQLRENSDIVKESILIDRLEHLTLNQLKAIKDLNSNNLLHLACYYNMERVAICLMKKGLSVNEKNQTLQTPLLLVCRKGSILLFKEIMIRNPDIHAKDINGSNSIHYLCGPGGNENDKESILKILINNGININILNKKEKTSIYYACSYRLYNLVKIFLQHNVMIDGRTLVEIMEKNFNPELRQKIISKSNLIPVKGIISLFLNLYYNQKLNLNDKIDRKTFLLDILKNIGDEKIKNELLPYCNKIRLTWDDHDSKLIMYLIDIIQSQQSGSSSNPTYFS